MRFSRQGRAALLLLFSALVAVGVLWNDARRLREAEQAAIAVDDSLQLAMAPAVVALAQGDDEAALLSEGVDERRALLIANAGRVPKAPLPSNINSDIERRDDAISPSPSLSAESTTAAPTTAVPSTVAPATAMPSTPTAPTMSSTAPTITSSTAAPTTTTSTAAPSPSSLPSASPSTASTPTKTSSTPKPSYSSSSNSTSSPTPIRVKGTRKYSPHLVPTPLDEGDELTYLPPYESLWEPGPLNKNPFGKPSIRLDCNRTEALALAGPPAPPIASIATNCTRETCQPVNGKTILFVIVPRYQGSTALAGLIGTSAYTVDMCAAHTWACEGTWVLIDRNVDGVGQEVFESPRARFRPSYPSNWTLVVDMFEEFWGDVDPDFTTVEPTVPKKANNKAPVEPPPFKCVAVEKSPPNVFKVRRIASQLRAAGRNVAFLFMTRSPCHLCSTSLEMALGQEVMIAQMAVAYRWLLRERFPVMHVRYDELMRNPGATAERIEAFLPCLGKIDINKSASRTRGNKRALPVGEYAKLYPLQGCRAGCWLSKTAYEAYQYFGHV